ncbi:hypothetical protein AAU57_08815 [Nonlabens sp. YIK11]|uniref:hypothetical protein n=1 Tax=Nonlabens sp. YIK11 TaxID=1453349 RepID=UPI00070799BF|nr:hypothetical protein [Nonlabens sp. YIK11]KQC33404.1 hypothetical protein AAU57_08815 [Nonlabens sp. YIK11]
MASNDYNNSIVAFFAKVTRLQDFIAMLVGAFLVFLVFFTPIIVDWDERVAKRQAETHLKQLKIEESARQMMDSLRLEKAALANEKFLYKNAQINNLITGLGMQINGASSINIIEVHNGGNVMLTSSESLVTVLYSNDFIRNVNIKQHYANYPLERGISRYFLMMLEADGKPVFIEDVRNYPNIYETASIQSLDLINVKSMIGCYIKAGTKGTYFISITYPYYQAKNEKDALYAMVLLSNARKDLLRLLDVK